MTSRICKYGKGTSAHSNGYVMILARNHPDADHHGYVMEHRLVMERYLGRRLKQNEIPHHKNGNRTDNRIQNLQLMTRAEHTRFHNPRKVKDMESRLCLWCGNKTRKIKTKIGNLVYAWYKHNDDFLCNKCYEKRRRLVL